MNRRKIQNHFSEADRQKLFCRLIDTPDRIKAAGIPDIRKTLRYHPDQEILIISKIHIPLRMSGKLRLTASLRCKKAESNHLPLLQVKAAPCVIIPKAVRRKPPVDMSGLPRLLHMLPEDLRLRLHTFFQTVFQRRCRLVRKGQLDSLGY